VQSITDKHIYHRLSILEGMLNLGSKISISLEGSYGKKQISLIHLKNYGHIEDLTYLGTKREVYEELGVAINVLRVYKNRVKLKKKYK